MYIQIHIQMHFVDWYPKPRQIFSICRFVDEEGIYFYRSEIRKALKLDFHK